VMPAVVGRIGPMGPMGRLFGASIDTTCWYSRGWSVNVAQEQGTFSLVRTGGVGRAMTATKLRGLRKAVASLPTSLKLRRTSCASLRDRTPN